jgi:hypothetical protein
MDPITAKLMAAAGAAKEATYVDDVFSTFLYEGNGVAQAIKNGINLGTAFGGNSYDFRGQTVMSRSSALSGAAASKTFTFSFWFYAKTLSGTIYTEPAGPTINFAGSDLAISGFNSSYSTVFGVSTGVTVGRWYHVLASWDLANSSNRYLYINDAAVSPTYSDYTNDTIAINVNGTRYVGSTNGSSGKFDGNIAHLYYDTTYRDLSTTSNRRLFVTAGLEPATGQASLNPLLYLPLNAATGAATNSGTGGDFTATTGPFFDEGFGPGTGTSGEGGLVWVKNRSTDGTSHVLVDTERGANKLLLSNLGGPEIDDTSYPSHIKSFLSTGFVVGDAGACNDSGDDYCSWTFRKCPGFFDIVTYTGNNTAGRQIAHNLGSVPGSIWIKRTDGTDSWVVYHRSLGNNKYMFLNTSSAALTDNNINWNGTSPTSTHFTVGDNSGYANGNNLTYVAYIFAHDDQSFGDDGDEAIIKCGSYTGNATNGKFIDLGFEPQWILVKRTDTSSKNWFLSDNMRGLSHNLISILYPNESWAEFSAANGSGSNYDIVQPRATGFELDNDFWNESGGNFIYIAIRRPNKPPSAGTEVLANKLIAGSSSTQTVSVSGAGVTDMTIIKNCTSASHAWITASRLLGNGETKMNVTNAESTATFGSSVNTWDQMSGTKLRYDIDINRNGYFYMHWQFTRKPGVFDVATYTGTGSNRTVSHNLGVTPELMIVKRRDSTGAWRVYSSVTGAGKYLRVDSNAAEATTSTRWNNTAPTSTAFTVGTASDVNASGGTYFNFLFATLAGVSKVGSYTGTGNDINVDCGFTAGARFVMIKRTDSSGDWFVFDTERGINSGNDSYLIVNSEANPVTDQDYIDPLNAGFTITSSAPADLNASGGTYIFLAIA